MFIYRTYMFISSINMSYKKIRKAIPFKQTGEKSII